MAMHPDDELDMLLDFIGAFQRREWGMFAISLIFWAVILVLLLCMAPFAALGGLYFGGKKIVLKFRRWGADKLRPKDVVRARNTEPQSDLVARFVDYELLLVSGKETMAARVALISELAHVEQELEEHRILCAEIRKLRVEDERPRRRDAILSTRRRSERRRQREQDEGTE
jgi:hypothetical protein